MQSKWFKRAVVTAFAGVVVLTAVSAIVWQLLDPPRLAVPEKDSLTLEGVWLVNPGMERGAAQSIAITDGTITSINPADSDEGPYTGHYVLPGLIDMHVHYPPKVAKGNHELWSLMFLAHGVTTVRDMGSADGSIFGLREDIRSGKLPGPRVYASGAMIDGPSPAFPSNHVVSTAEEARAKVNEQVDLGADFVKVYNMLSEESIRAIREAADERGVKVVGHMPIATPIETGLVNDIQHVTGIPEQSDVEEQTRQRADYLIDDVIAIDDARIESMIELFREHDMAFTPTIINQRMRRKQCEPITDPQDATVALLPDYWPATWRMVFGTPYTPGDEWEPKFHAGWDMHKELVRRFHAAGVRVHLGTDTMMPFVAPGISLHGELEEFVDAGLSPEEAWELATRGNGDYLSEDGLGIIAEGAPADLLVFREDPTRNLKNLDSLVAVIADGRVYTREELDAAMELYQNHFHGELYETIMNLPVKVLRRVYAPD